MSHNVEDCETSLSPPSPPPQPLLTVLLPHQSLFLPSFRAAHAAEVHLLALLSLAYIYFRLFFFPLIFLHFNQLVRKHCLSFPRGKPGETNDPRIVLFRGQEIDRKLTDVIDDEEAIIKRIFAAAVANGDKDQQR